MGAFLALLAWLLIALILSFDLSFSQIIDFIKTTIYGAKIPMEKLDQVFHNQPFNSRYDEADLIPLDDDLQLETKSPLEELITPEPVIKEISKYTLDPSKHGRYFGIWDTPGRE